MAVSDRNTLKNFFGTGQVPLAQHFADLVDSSLNKQEDGITKSSSTPLAITTGSVVNAQRQGILFLSGEELAIHLPPVDGVDGSFSLQIPSDSPTDHLQVDFVGTSSDTPRVTLVQGPVPGGGASSFVLDPNDSHHLQIFIPTDPTAIENLTELTAAVSRGGFTVTRQGAATFNLRPSFPNGQWHLGLQDNTPAATPDGGLYIGNGDQQPLFIQNQTGFVGIGTHVPTAALEVDGGLKVDGLDVKLTLDGLVTTVGDASRGLVSQVSGLATTVGDASSGLVSQVSGLATTVGDASSGLVSQVSGLATTVGDANSGLVNQVSGLATTVGDASRGLVSQVSGLTTTVGDASSGLVSQVSGLTTTVGDAGRGLVSQVNALETKVGSVGDGDEAATGLVGQISALDSQLSSLASEVGSVGDGDEAATGLVGKVAELETLVGKPDDAASMITLFDKIAALENRVDGLEE